MNLPRYSFIALSLTLIVSLLATSTGCGTTSGDGKAGKLFSLDNTWPFRDKDQPQEGTPVRMVGTWTDTILTKQGQKPQRGFGGRIMFYEKDEDKPILVDGQLVVYAFDETGRDPTDNKPTRRYVFPAEQIPQHMSKSEIGASYSFWLPWDEAGGPRTQVSLICRFEPTDGPIITSEQTKHLLPGTVPMNIAAGKQPPKLPEGVPSKPTRETLESIRARQATPQGAQQASYETAMPSGSGSAAAVTDAATLAPRKMSATTITLPDNYQLPGGAGIQSQVIKSQNAARPQIQLPQAPVNSDAAVVPQQAPLPLSAAQAVAAPTINAQPPATFGIAQQPMPMSQAMQLQAPRPFSPPATTWASGPIASSPSAPQSSAAHQMLPQQMGQVPAWPQAGLQSTGTATVSSLPANQTFR
jgi:hypothetical protein